ncbi:MAG: DOMON-like domain-containing protein [Nitrospirota bacterium]
MKVKDLSLRPFTSDGAVSGLRLKASIKRDSDIFTLGYTLTGPVAGLGLPAAARKTSRKKALWEDTCFELFLGVRNSPRYWEFNISPAGDWNVYRFNDYRKDMQEEPAINSLPVIIEHSPEAFRLFVNINLEVIIPADKVVEAALSAVIKQVNGPATYWALEHKGPRPDFHRRDGFIIEL